MADRTTLNVSLTPELLRFIEERVESGRYQTASEVVRAALRMYADHEAALAEVRAKIAEGLADIEAGRVVDGEEFFEEWREQLRRMKADQAGDAAA